MIRPQFPIEGLEPDAAEAFAAGVPEPVAVQLSIAISLKRFVDLQQQVADGPQYEIETAP